MKLYIRSKPQPKEGRGELEIDVGGLNEWDAEDFVEEVKRRVTIRSKPRSRSRVCRDDDYESCGTRRRSNRQVIDVNINVRD